MNICLPPPRPYASEFQSVFKKWPTKRSQSILNLKLKFRLGHTERPRMACQEGKVYAPDSFLYFLGAFLRGAFSPCYTFNSARISSPNHWICSKKVLIEPDHRLLPNGHGSLQFLGILSHLFPHYTNESEPSKSV